MNLLARLMRPPLLPISLFINIFMAIWAALPTASCLEALPETLPEALCWSNSLAACAMARPTNWFCELPPLLLPDEPPVNIFRACIAAALPIIPESACDEPPWLPYIC